jgi:hypothetical protein
MRAFVFGRRPSVRAVVVVGSTFALLGSWLAEGGTDPAQATETTLATFNTPGPNWWTVGWFGGNHGYLNELGRGRGHLG